MEAHATALRIKDVVGTRGGEPAYLNSELAQQLRPAARLLKADASTHVFYTRQPAYDTHAAQYASHFQLLGALSAGLKAFLADLSAARWAERVVVLCFSGLGWTVRENGSVSTDHGTAGPVLLAGPTLRGGLVGATPSLTDLDPRQSDLKVGIDFRRVYAAVLEGWLGLPATAALGGRFEELPLFRS